MRPRAAPFGFITHDAGRPSGALADLISLVNHIPHRTNTTNSTTVPNNVRISKRCYRPGSASLLNIPSPPGLNPIFFPGARNATRRASYCGPRWHISPAYLLSTFLRVVLMLKKILFAFCHRLPWVTARPVGTCSGKKGNPE